MRKRIRLTESDIHRIVKESIGKILKESSWDDGQKMIQAYHITTVGAEDSNQDESDFAYHIYDRLTHNEMTADEAIRAITNGDLTSDTEPEVVSRDAVNFGTSSDGRYFLTYDKYTGAFDVWEHTMNESKGRKAAKKGEHISSALKHGLNYQKKAEKICESSKYEGLSFKMKVWEVINDALYNAFGDDFGCGNGWDVTNPDNEDEYVHITFGG